MKTDAQILKKITLNFLAYLIADHKPLMREDWSDEIKAFWDLYKAKGSLNLTQEKIDEISHYYCCHRYPWFRTCLAKNKPLGDDFKKAFEFFETV